MSINADDTGTHRALPRLIRFADLPRQPLDQGRGSAREIWAELAPDLGLTWHLRVVEIRDSTGLLIGPAGTHNYVVGMAGPQVAVRIAGTSRALRRGLVMPVPSCRVQFDRSKLRPPGVSSLLLLTCAGTVDPPGFAPGFAPGPADSGTDLPARTRLLVALRETVHLDGAVAQPGSALLLDPAESYRLHDPAPSILAVTLPDPERVDLTRSAKSHRGGARA
jgi:hypothetical protein